MCIGPFRAKDTTLPPPPPLPAPPPPPPVPETPVPAPSPLETGINARVRRDQSQKVGSSDAKGTKGLRIRLSPDKTGLNVGPYQQNTNAGDPMA
jgi:hypothetical protein